ncbi:hypothetical protein EV401DRAFT_2054323 [Pisolithus croceorrhizus]|nr:hypothetical protein EV401DRAFT_2054323 [Pisolithus croceorrhizus]
MTSPTNSPPSIEGSSAKGVDATQPVDGISATKDEDQLYNPYVDLSRGTNLCSMETDFHLTDTQCLLCLSTFFILYAIFEAGFRQPSLPQPPSHITSYLLMVGWGIMLVLKLVSLWIGTFIAVSTKSGASHWYKRSGFGIHAAIFFSAATVSGAFGGLLAAAISDTNGVDCRPAFIMEGLVTVVVTAISFWIIVDFPDDAKFSTEMERTVVTRRLRGDNQCSAVGEKFKWKYTNSLTEWKTYVAVLIRHFAFFFSLFLSSIIRKEQCHTGPSYKAIPANLTTVPVYFVACISTRAIGLLVDWYGQSRIIQPIPASWYNIPTASCRAELSYFVYIPYMIARVWVSNNVQGSYKRSVSLAMVISWGNTQGAVSSNIYCANQTPWCPSGGERVLMYIVAGLIATWSSIIEGWNGGSAGNARYSRREEGEGRLDWSGYRRTPIQRDVRMRG